MPVWQTESPHIPDATEAARPSACENVTADQCFASAGSEFEQYRYLNSAKAAHAGLSIDPEDARFYCLLASACIQSGSYEMAKSHAQTAITLAPKSHGGYARLSAAMHLMGKPKAAKSYQKLAVDRGAVFDAVVD